MARVDFYLLKKSGVESRFAFACRLAEKAYRLHNTVHIHTSDEGHASQIDDLLWTFRDGSFVPHNSVNDRDSSPPSPVRISCGSADVEPCDLLINLCDDIPHFAEAFPRVAELVSSDDSCKQESRKRFAAYREKGHSLETHDV